MDKLEHQLTWYQDCRPDTGEGKVNKAYLEKELARLHRKGHRAEIRQRKSCPTDHAIFTERLPGMA